MNNTEKKTVRKMIGIYCAAKHGYKKSLCPDCLGLNDYAQKRLEYCKFGENKPNCKNCPIHCYKPDMKTEMQKVMRFSGPRMLLQNPILSIIHLKKSLKKV